MARRNRPCLRKQAKTSLEAPTFANTTSASPMSPHLQLQKKKIMIKKMVFSDGMAGMYQKPVA